MDERGIRLIQHDSEHGRWELVHGLPHPSLSWCVRGYQGYLEAATTFARRLEVPHPDVVLIVNLGPAIRVLGPGHPASGGDFGSFIAGLHDVPVFVESTGPMRCLQVDLSPIGAALLLRVPMHELANRTISLAELIGGEANRLEERLDAAPDWPARFAILDEVLGRRLGALEPRSAGVRRAWQRLHASGGLVPVKEIAAEVGWSRKHLLLQFRDHVGLPPKTLARIIRFNRTLRCLEGIEAPHWAEIAHACGYYDQAHFNRDFRAFAGTTPGDYLRRRIAEGGVVGD